MDYEKLHKDTIAKLQEMVNSGKITAETARGICADFVPESEDERIRKGLISYFRDFHLQTFAGLDPKRIKAWLEKQGKSNMGISEATKKKLEDNLNKALEKETPESWNKFLDEQGEPSVKWNKNTDSNKPQRNHSVLMKTTHGIAEGERRADGSWLQYRWSSMIKDSDVLFWIELSDLEKQGEQNPTEWSEEDDKMYNSLTEFEKAVKQVMEEAIECGDTHNLKADADMLLRLAQKPTEWSEKDKKIIIQIRDAVEDYFPTPVADKIKSWLNSLKNRVQPQPKREWSEEDIYKIEDALFRTYAVDVAARLLNKIKSLRPQNRWKPSDEQMEALLKLEEMHVLEHEKNQENAHLYMMVKSIREQLLKLREE